MKEQAKNLIDKLYQVADMDERDEYDENEMSRLTRQIRPGKGQRLSNDVRTKYSRSPQEKELWKEVFFAKRP